MQPLDSKFWHIVFRYDSRDIGVTCGRFVILNISGCFVILDSSGRFVILDCSGRFLILVAGLWFRALVANFDFGLECLDSSGRFVIKVFLYFVSLLRRKKFEAWSLYRASHNYWTPCIKRTVAVRSHGLLSGEPDKVAVTDSYAAPLPWFSNTKITWSQVKWTLAPKLCAFVDWNLYQVDRSMENSSFIFIRLKFTRLNILYFKTFILVINWYSIHPKHLESKCPPFSLLGFHSK